MRAIEAAFTADPDAAFSTDELCRAVYQSPRSGIGWPCSARSGMIQGSLEQHSSQYPFEHDDPPARLN